MNDDSTWKAKTVMLGAIGGAAIGVLAAMMVVRRAEREGAYPEIGPGEWIKLGLALLGLLRLVSQFSESSEERRELEG